MRNVSSDNRVVLYELTHGHAYLVFKYQLHNLNLLRRGEITDYTEAILYVNRQMTFFNLFFKSP